MNKVEAIAQLVLIDGVTYQIVLPKSIVVITAKQALIMAQEFGGKLIPCDFANIRPMDADGMPFNVSDSGAENENNNNS